MNIQAERDRFEADTLYLDAHRDELLARYPEQWVAVYKLEVVGVAKEMEQLVKELKQNGVPPEYSYCEYLSAEPITLIVASGDR